MNINCPNCGVKLTNPLICDSCKEFNSQASSLNHFELLNIDQDFNLDLAKIDSAYEFILSKIHPDLFSLESAEKQKLSLILSSKLMAAKEELSDPISRGLYILNLQGFKTESVALKVDIDFLQEVLEIQEYISDNNEATSEQLDYVEKNFAEINNRLNSNFKILISGNKQVLEQVKQDLAKYRYFLNIQQQIATAKNAG